MKNSTTITIKVSNLIFMIFMFIPRVPRPEAGPCKPRRGRGKNEAEVFKIFLGRGQSEAEAEKYFRGHNFGIRDWPWIQPQRENLMKYTYHIILAACFRTHFQSSYFRATARKWIEFLR